MTENQQDYKGYVIRVVTSQMSIPSGGITSRVVWSTQTVYTAEVLIPNYGGVQGVFQTTNLNASAGTYDGAVAAAKANIDAVGEYQPQVPVTSREIPTAAPQSPYSTEVTTTQGQGSWAARGVAVSGYWLALPRPVVRLLWKFRERYISKEVHRKLHPLV